ncbi:MAG: TrbI/VirB10 family protein [Pseudomonadota bacterium]
MSWLCDLAMVAGLTLSGTCQPATPQLDPLPADDPAAWSYKAPEPPKEEPKPPPAPSFPPVVIRHEVVREVPAPAPSPKVEESPGPNPIELAVEASYRSRAAGAAGWTDITVPASLPGGAAGPDMPRAALPPMPLDLGATVSGTGDVEYQEKSIISSPPVDNSRMITTDRIITGIVENSTNSQLDGTVGGTIVIQVSRDVFGYHGRNLLVPKGSRLVCGYKSLDKVGASRAAWRCGRLLAGGSRYEIFGMKSNVFDSQGHLGVSGDVDNRFFERYGTAFILAGVSAAVRAASAASAGTVSSSSTATATGSSSTYSGNTGVLATGGMELSQRLGEITATTLEQTINLNPILRTFQGQRVQIRPDTDWYIAKVE